jgi:hypothetical protein
MRVRLNFSWKSVWNWSLRIPDIYEILIKKSTRFHRVLFLFVDGAIFADEQLTQTHP